MDQVDDFRLLTALVEAGSLSAAARRLGSSTPAMSRRLAALEARLGVRLVERSARRFMLTEHGALLHERALRIVRDIAEAEAAVAAQGETPGGLLRVGAPAAFGRRVVAPMLARFRTRCPNLDVVLTLSDAELDPVDDQLDLVLRNGPPTAPGVTARPLLASRRIACATSDYLRTHGTPQVPDDLARHECIRQVRGRRVLDDWLFTDGARGTRSRTVRVSGSLASTSGDVVHDWILAGLGIGLQAEWDVDAELREGLLVECLPEFWCDEITLHACVASEDRVPLRVRAFTAFLVEALDASVKRKHKTRK